MINERLVIVGPEGNFSYDYVLKEGENVFKIKAQDKAGNAQLGRGLFRCQSPSLLEASVLSLKILFQEGKGEKDDRA